MKKILIVSESVVYTDSNNEIYARGGGEISVHKFAKIYHALGFDVTVLGMNENNLSKNEDLIEGVNYIYFNSYDRKSMVDVFRFLKFAHKYAKSYDFVFLNQFVPHLLLPFLAEKKKIVLIHDLYVEFKKWKLAHGYIYGFCGYVTEKCMVLLDKFFASHIVVVSDETKQKFGLSSKVVVISNYIEDNLSNVEKGDYILFVGRFVEYKRPNDVLHVLKYLIDNGFNIKAKFVVSRVDEHVMESFKKLALEIGVMSAVEIIDWTLSNSELQRIMTSALLLVHPSIFEGQGLVVYEALTLGVPVVAYDLNVYKKNLAGLSLVPVCDVVSLSGEAFKALSAKADSHLGSRVHEFGMEFVKSKMANLLGLSL